MPLQEGNATVAMIGAGEIVDLFFREGPKCKGLYMTTFFLAGAAESAAGPRSISHRKIPFGGKDLGRESVSHDVPPGRKHKPLLRERRFDQDDHA